jgi:hypothetical protein
LSARVEQRAGRYLRHAGDLIVDATQPDVCNWASGSQSDSVGHEEICKPIPAGTQMMDGFSVSTYMRTHAPGPTSLFHPYRRELATPVYMIFGEKSEYPIGAFTSTA